MWEQHLPPVSDELRQGDLLNDVPFVSQILFDVDAPCPQQQWAESVIRLPALVVGQCCTIEQRRVAALAPVAETAILAPRDRYLIALMTDEYPLDPAAPYVNHKFRVEPIGDVEPSVTGAHRVADLLQIAPFAADDAALMAKRVARMTVVARRNLRTKLAIFWSRPEPEDATELEALGLQALNLPSALFESRPSSST